MRLYGLIGFPLAQSFSKKYFDEKFAVEGFKDYRFENFPISSISDFQSVVLDENPALNGLAVTIPYKQAVLKYLHSAENIPEGLSACNCIRIVDNKLIGYNTDYIGFEKSILPVLKPHHTRALILGNGGATAAVAFVLNRLKIKFDIVSRKIHDGATFIYNDLTEKIINEHTVIINTTPLGMYPDIDSFPPIPYSFISKDHLLYDLIYNPGKTIFLQKGEEKGAVVKNGMDMLELQAEENWKIWNS